MNTKKRNALQATLGLFLILMLCLTEAQSPIGAGLADAASAGANAL